MDTLGKSGGTSHQIMRVGIVSYGEIPVFGRALMRTIGSWKPALQRISPKVIEEDRGRYVEGGDGRGVWEARGRERRRAAA